MRGTAIAECKRLKNRLESALFKRLFQVHPRWSIYPSSKDAGISIWLDECDVLIEIVGKTLKFKMEANQSSSVLQLERPVDRFNRNIDDAICLIERLIEHAAQMCDVVLDPKEMSRAQNVDGPKVYCIANNDGMVKIGTTTDIFKRMASLQTGSAGELHLIGTIDGGREVEREIHRRFAKWRRSGEWFLPGDDGEFRQYLHETFGYPQAGVLCLFKAFL